MSASKYLYDPTKLRDQALQEFRRSLRNDRMVAITGAMATEALGYFDWYGLERAIGELAVSALAPFKTGDDQSQNTAIMQHTKSIKHCSAINVEAVTSEIARVAEKLINSDRGEIDHRVAFRLIQDLLTNLPSPEEGFANAGEKFEADIAKLFLTRKKGNARGGAIRPLIEGLGITRFATLNFDHELERALMLREDERSGSVQSKISKPDGNGPILKDKTGKLTRMMGDGMLVESDWVERHRPDRLLEFAIGSTEVDRHIMHLHGRADKPISMIVDTKDYDGLYRRDDLNRTPFEYGMQALLGGNPILLVGMGMSEEEINSQLRFFVSNAHKANLGPTFLIWNTIGWSIDAEVREVDEDTILKRMHDKRIDFLVRLGVHIIFDRDLVRVDPDKNGSLDLSNWLRPLAGTELGNHPELLTLEQLQALHRLVHLDKAIAKNTKAIGETRAVKRKAIAGPEKDYFERIGRGLEARAADLLRDKNALIKAIERWYEQDEQPNAALRNHHLKNWLERIEGNEANEGRQSLERDVALEALAVTLDALPGVVDYLGQFSPRPWSEIDQAPSGNAERWRNINTRMKRHPKGEPVRMWGAPLLAQCGSRDADIEFSSFRYENQGHARRSPLVLGIAGAGAGRGKFAERVVQAKEVPDKDDTNILRRALNNCKIGNRLVIHAGFSYDADSTLSGIAQFLAARLDKTARRRVLNEHKDVECRQRAFTSGELFKTPKKCLIVINGIDRFFSIHGQPLSAEFDLLFRSIAAHQKQSCEEPTVNWLVLGTPRVRRYFEMLDAICLELTLGDLCPKIDQPSRNEQDPILRPGIDSAYLEWVAKNYDEKERESRKAAHEQDRKFRQRGPSQAGAAKIARAQEIDTDSVRRTFFSSYLAPYYLNKIGVFCPETFEILRTMAFIGTPIEAVVLLFAPKVREVVRGVERPEEDAVKENLSLQDQARVRGVLEQLLQLGLIIQVAPRKHGEDGSGSPRPLCPKDKPEERLSNTDFFRIRFGLHRSIATELRERHGAPITEAKLSTSFNMSLFAAQPEERYTPEARFHRELGQLVDRLIGAWKELDDHPTGEPAVEFQNPLVRNIDKETIKKRLGLDKQEANSGREFARLLVNRSEADRFDAMHNLSSFASSACLRAALAIVRGYYSTGNLLQSNNPGAALADGERGALSEHSSRLDRILRNFGNVTTARHLYRKITKESVKDIKEKDGPEAAEEARRAANLAMGPEPFYPDDLVWLHNERGVLKMIQGAVYSARRSFSLAERANGEVEPGYHGHNWRRINMNLVALLIERGRLPRAERRLDSIEATINTPDWQFRTTTSPQARAGGNDNLASSIDRVTQIRRKFGAEDSQSTKTLDHEYSSEELLIVGLSTGYRGLIGQMRGEFAEAAERYRIAIRILRRIGEMRAYGLFARHLASMGSMVMPRKDRLNLIEQAITAVDSVQQMDLSHRLRILRAVINRSVDDAEINRFALHDLHRALDYSVETDCFRVRIEAGAALARHMRLSGDYEAALRYGADALAIAARYGHALQKIWLRVEIGQIMMMRSSHDAGLALLASAERAAIRTGYQRTIEHVQKARTQIQSTGRPTRRVVGFTAERQT